MEFKIDQLIESNQVRVRVRVRVRINRMIVSIPNPNPNFNPNPNPNQKKSKNARLLNSEETRTKFSSSRAISVLGFDCEWQPEG
jgi:hypothetical protein